MRTLHRRPAFPALSCLLLACLLASPVAPASPLASPFFSVAQASLPASTGAPPDYGDTYTPEMLATIDQALKAINCTRADLMFEKDYGKGYACFPVVRDMLRDPLLIAPFIEGLVTSKKLWNDQQPELSSADATTTALRLSTQELWSNELDVSIYAQMRWTPPLSAPEELTQQELLDRLTAMAAPLAVQGRLGLGLKQTDQVFPSPLGEPDLALLAAGLPKAMAWHSINTGAPVRSDAQSSIDTFKSAEQLDMRWFIGGMCSLLGQNALSPGFLANIPKTVFPENAPLIVDTEYGRICLGTTKDDTYSGDFAVLIEPGGNDRYSNCRLAGAGAGLDEVTTSGRVAYFVDLGGDDVYDCGEVDVTLGAAVLGVAAFYDLGAGNDVYRAGSCSLGAAMGGIALFYDDGGSDTYSGKVYTQGAAGFGIGIMIDDSVQPAPDIPTDVETPDPIDLRALDNDTYTAWSEAQAFARTRGVALCLNRRGNEVYHAGGVYLHAPLFSDRYQSFSQGFAIGERDIDYAGGIALLADYEGNDRYLGDIYNQGVGYWYSAGLLYDGGGNDTYEMTQYGQGSGIHLAVGGLVDESGHDTYVMHSGLGQGSSHDFATSILLDRSGNDKYYGTTTSCGASLTNSACLFLDGGGDDTYAARNEGGLNYGRPARDAGSIGLFIDMAGKDDYLGKFADGRSWTSSQYGSGVDVAPPPIDPVAQASVPADPQNAGRDAHATKNQPSQSAGGLAVPTDKTVIPEIVGYSGPLTQAVFDELWEIAIRWEVGDNQLIVPKARERLIAFGPDVLPYVEAKMDDPNSLAIRGYVDVLKAFAFAPVAPAPSPESSKQQAAGGQSPAPPQPAQTLPLVEALVQRQLGSGSEPRQIAALSVATELGLTGVGDGVAALLDSPDLGMQRRALGALGTLGSHAADARIIALLDPATDERLLKSAIVAATKLKLDCYDEKLRYLLDVPKFTARDALVGQLAAVMGDYGWGLQDDYYKMNGPLSVTAQRSMLRVWLAADVEPEWVMGMVKDLPHYLASDDWGLRSDAVALAEHWRLLAADQPELLALFTAPDGVDQAVAAARARAGDPWPARNP